MIDKQELIEKLETLKKRDLQRYEMDEGDNRDIAEETFDMVIKLIEGM